MRQKYENDLLRLPNVNGVAIAEGRFEESEYPDKHLSQKQSLILHASFFKMAETWSDNCLILPSSNDLIDRMEDLKSQAESMRPWLDETRSKKEGDMTMSLTSSPLQTIADTARWVAFYRALESERPDAHFHDPYARLLAGERGQEIVRTLPWGQSLSWAVVVRTCLFDEILLQVVQKDEVDMVLNLAAGLDTRPYRLALPASLQWIEVDLPEILSDKEEQLANEHPVCRLERVKLDLADSEGRNALFAHLNAAAKQVLVIAEGLLTYLTPEQVASLATDLHAQAAFRWWLTEYISPCVLKLSQSAWNQHLAAANARMQFAPEEGEKFFERYGWSVPEFRSTWEEASRLKRDMPFGWLLRLWACFLPQACRETYRKLSGALLLERK